ncbi:MAG: aminotransferase class III-fold pyridoxal phosphate-dependent enzyme [Bacteroidetes bacterium]|nr:aminotransferase class III-fold pyridoxal phosphate-dependent enzyme [Bacteroidota bacterium]
MKLFNVYPINDITITRARGSRVWDDIGTEYLDMYGGHAVISIGHQHPHWVKRITDQLDKIAFYSNSIRIPIQEELATKLGEVSNKPHFELFLCNSGAEANENALKLASFHTGRKKVIAFKKSFHGRTSLAVAATDNPSIVAPVNATDNVLFLPWNDAEAITKIFAEQGHEIAAVIIEGIQGVGGIHVASNELLQLLRTCCDKYGSVLIADSVQCGYGRSGKFFSHDHAGIEADIYSMAKGMGNGFPIGGIMISPKIPSRHFMLGTTFGGNHLACAAGLAVLEVMQQESLMHHAATMGNYLMNELKAIPEIHNVRGMGLMIGFDVPEKLNNLKKNLLSSYKIFTGEAKPNVIRLLPSLALTEEDAAIFIQSLKQAIAHHP